MKMKNTLLIVAVASLLAGCASLPVVTNQTPEQIASQSAIKRDDFAKTISVEGQNILFGDWSQNRYYLSAVKTLNSDHVLISLVIFTRRSYQQGWAFWEMAYDSDGNKLPSDRVASEVRDGGGTSEAFQISLSRDYLDKHQDGFKLKIYGSRAQQILSVPGNYVRGFLLKVDQGFAQP
jgi:hypothetical protein